jgi:hypothetical protein
MDDYMRHRHCATPRVMAAPSTPSRVAAAVARWTSSARSAAPFFARAVLVLDEDAARAMETSIGARALGETCEIVAACAVRDVVRDDGESADIYGFDGARVCDDAPVVMCFGRALARCAEDVERVARARSSVSRGRIRRVRRWRRRGARVDGGGANGNVYARARGRWRGEGGWCRG